MEYGGIWKWHVWKTVPTVVSVPNCPSQAIEVDKEERTWSLDRKRCINCNGCAEICPKDCLEMETGYFHPVLEGGPVTETIVGPPAEEPAKAQE